MNETTEKPDPVPRWIILVGGVVQVKAYNMIGVGEFVQEASGTTNEEIEVYSIH